MNKRNTWIDIITRLYREVMHTASESDKNQELNCKEEISFGDLDLNDADVK